MVSIDRKLGANAIIKKGLRHYADHPACPLLRVKTYLFSIIVYFIRFLNLKVVVCSSCFQPGEKNLVWAGLLSDYTSSDFAKVRLEL